MSVRTRFAPSPTGELHLGNARTAILNWAFARRHGGAFVLRYEDTDVERNVEEAEARIEAGLAWLGTEPDEAPRKGGAHEPYRQSQRLPMYREHADRLRGAGAAYRCYCTPEELEVRRERAKDEGRPPVYDGRCRGLTPEREEELRAEGRRPSVRFRVDPGPVSFRDRVRGEVTIHGSEFGDFVLLRSDGRPTYNFAVVVDDLLMEITHVIRGVGHLANTPKQLLLYRAMERQPPEFAHIPLVKAPGGGPLSKRKGAPGLLDYRDRGFHPDAVLNYLSLLSWSSESGDEFLTRERIVAEVDLDRIGSSDAELDPGKMEWLSGRHIRREAPERLARRIRPHLGEPGAGLSDRDLRALAEVLRERIQLLSEARDEAARLFPNPEPVAAAREALETAGAQRVLTTAADAWGSLDDWTRSGLREALDRAAEVADVGGRRLYHPLRAALTGVLEGPEVPDVAYILGRRRTLDRLRDAAATAAAASEAGGERRV